MKEERQLAVIDKTAQPCFNFFDPVQFDTMQRVCKLFASSELVPEMYKFSEKNPIEKAMANCMIAIEMAQRIGASPLMIMQNMIIIYGRPSWSSKFLVATVNTCGRFNPLQYRFTEKGGLGKVDYTEYTKTWINGTNGGKGYYKNDAKTTTFDGTKIQDIECIAYTTAKGSDKVLESSPVSVKLAVQEGWYTKNGSKWQTMTKQMLMYRAASFWTNAYAPELSMGMKTDDELRDIVDVDYEDIKEDVTDRVRVEINEKGNAGNPMSFEQLENKPADKTEAEPGKETPLPAETQSNEQTPPPAGPQAETTQTKRGNTQTSMPGF
jgi:hypothetical protein